MKFRTNLEWYRPNTSNGKVILLDGLTGAGKTMLMRLIDCYPEIAAPRFDYQLEQLCIALAADKIERDAGTQLLQLLMDQRQYDSKIAREVNFRPRDLSSVFKSAKKYQYLARLFKSDQFAKPEDDDKSFFVVHQLLSATKCFSFMPGREFVKILAVRHPFYLFDHWVSYVGLHGNDPKDFTVTVGKPYTTPWFIKENRKVYLDSSVEDRAAIAIAELSKQQEKYIGADKTLLVVDFEKFVLEPKVYLSNLERKISVSSLSLRAVMKKEHLPRVHINDSKQLRIYRRYNSHYLTDKLNHKEDYIYLRKRISESVSSRAFRMLQTAASSYEDRFGLWF